MGDSTQICGSHGQCSLTGGGCGCASGYAGTDCGECVLGFVRVGNTCQPHDLDDGAAAPWYLAWWFLFLLILLFICCCVLCLACLRDRGTKAEKILPASPEPDANWKPHLADLRFIGPQVQRPVYRLEVHDALLAPAYTLQGHTARHNSLDLGAELGTRNAQAYSLDAATDVRGRQAMRGNCTWRSRRCASMSEDMAHACTLYNDGRTRLRPEYMLGPICSPEHLTIDRSHPLPHVYTVDEARSAPLSAIVTDSGTDRTLQRAEGLHATLRSGQSRSKFDLAYAESGQLPRHRAIEQVPYIDWAQSGVPAANALYAGTVPIHSDMMQNICSLWQLMDT